MASWGERYRIEIPIIVDNRAGAQFQQVQVQVHAMERAAQRAQRSLVRMARPWRVQMTLNDRMTAPLRLITRMLGAIPRAITLPINITGNAINFLGARGPLTTLNRRVQGVATGLLQTLMNPKTFVSGALATGLAGAAFTFPISLAADLERASTAFRTMFKSIQEGKGQMTSFGEATKLSADFIGDLQEFSRKTPFEFPNLVDAATKLATVGYEGKEILTMMGGIGDAVAGLGGGVEQIDRIVLAFAQIRQTGKLQGDELRQLYEARIPALKLLTRGIMQEQEERRSKGLKLGETEVKTQAQMQKMIIAGVVPAERALRIITEQMSKEWPDMMKEQSRTLRGLWSTVRETFNLRVILPFGQGLSEVIQPRLMALVDWLDANKGALDRVATGIKSFGRAVATFIVLPVERAIKGLGKLFANPEFQNASLGKQIGMIFESFLGQVTNRMGIFGTVIRVMVKNFVSAIGGIARAIPVVLGWIGKLSDFLGRELGPSIEAVANSFRGNLGKTFQFYVTTFIPQMLTRFAQLLEVITGGKVKADTLAKGFTGNLRGGLMWLATVGIPTFFKAIQDALTWIAGPGMDMVIKAAAWLKENLGPAFEKAGKEGEKLTGAWENIKKFWETGLRPAMKEVGEFIQTHVRGTMERTGHFITMEFLPALEKVKLFLDTNLPPAIEKAREFIDTKLLPAVERLSTFIKEDLNPIIERFYGEHAPKMQIQIGGIAGVILSLIPNLMNLWSWLSEKLAPVMAWMSTNIMPIFTDIWATLGVYVERVRLFFSHLHEKLSEWGVYEKIGTVVSNVSAIYHGFDTILWSIVGTIAKVVMGFTDWDKVGGQVASTIGSARDILKMFIPSVELTTFAAEMLAAMLKTVVDMLERVTSRIKYFLDDVARIINWVGDNVDVFKKIFDARSPQEFLEAVKGVKKSFDEMWKNRPPFPPGGGGIGAPGGLMGGAAAAGGLGGASYQTAAEVAIEKGLGNVGSQKWIDRINGNIITKCLGFVDDMFGSLTRYGDAGKAGDMLVKDEVTAMKDVVRGQLLFFKRDATNANFGHVAVALGGGSFLHSAGKGVEVIKPEDPSYKYWTSMYRGTGTADIAAARESAQAGVPATGATDVAHLKQYARHVAQEYKLDEETFLRQIQQESGWAEDVISGSRRSSAGARGIAQFMQPTGASVARQLKIPEAEFWASPEHQLLGMGHLMRQLVDKYKGDYSLALAAYNAGEGNVAKAGGIPAFKETQNYVRKIMGWEGPKTTFGRGGGPDGGMGMGVGGGAVGQPTTTTINLVFPSVTNLNEADARVFAKRIWEALADEGAARIDEVAANMVVE